MQNTLISGSLLISILATLAPAGESLPTIPPAPCTDEQKQAAEAFVTARKSSQDYEWYVHQPIALKAGIKPGVVAAIADRRRPVGMSEDGDHASYALLAMRLTWPSARCRRTASTWSAYPNNVQHCRESFRPRKSWPL